MQPFQEQDHSIEAKLIAQYEENMIKLTEFYRQRAKKHWGLPKETGTLSDVLTLKHTEFQR
jgi:hypothetical protein